MLSSPKRAAWKYQPAQLVPSGHGPNEVEGRRRRLAGSSHLIEAFHAKATYELRVLVLAGRSRPIPEVTPTAARTE